MSEGRKRRYHNRSRRGCVQCKSRHIRCDERKPYCRNCVRFGTECDYPADNVVKEAAYQTRIEFLQDFQSSISPRRIFSLANSIINIYDPFDALPIALDHNSSFLLDHYNKYRILVSIPIRKTPGGEMWDLVIKDEVFMHSAIMLAARHYMLLGGHKASVSAALYHHKGEVIRIVNQRLGDPVLATQDSTMAAVAAITILESTNGSPGPVRQHLNGLYQIVKVRGGLQVGKLSPLVQRMIQLADVMATGVTGTRSYLQRTSSAIIQPMEPDHSPAQVIRSRDSQTRGLEPRQSSEINSPDYSNGYIITELRTLSFQVLARPGITRSTHAASISSKTEEEEASLESRITTLERHINDAIHLSTHPRDLPVDNTYLVNGAYLLASNMYLYLFLRNYKTEEPIYKWMILLLLEDFERQMGHIRKTYPPELLFWVLSIGRLAAVEESHVAWFRRELGIVGMRLGMRSWERTRKILGCLVWIEGYEWLDYKKILTRDGFFERVQSPDQIIDPGVLGTNSERVED